MDTLSLNVGLTKDILTALAAIVIAIIAILSYRRARDTVLQPEVIRRQSELLSDLARFLSDFDVAHSRKPDYLGLITLNVSHLLSSYGFITNNQEQLVKVTKEESAGFLWVSEATRIPDVEVVPSIRARGLEDKTPNGQTSDLGKERYNQAKAGIIDIDRVWLTPAYEEFAGRLSDYLRDPLMPSQVGAALAKVRDEIRVNLTVHMRETLRQFMVVFCNRYFAGEKNLAIEPAGVYNDFNRKRIPHREHVEGLRKAIRNHLRVDTVW